MEIVALFCAIDDFCFKFEPAWQRLVIERKAQPLWASRLCWSVVIMIVGFHRSGYRTFKDYFLCYITPHLSWAFPHAVSYTQFVQLMETALVPPVFICRYAREK